MGRRRTGEELRQTQREEGHREERHREEACPLSWDLETLSQSQRASVLVPIKIMPFESIYYIYEIDIQATADI